MLTNYLLLVLMGLMGHLCDGAIVTSTARSAATAVGAGTGAAAAAGSTTTASGTAAPQLYCTDDNDAKFMLPIGEQGPGPRGQCLFVKCENVVDNKPVLTAIGCGVFLATPGCKFTDYDRTKLYPDCCPNEIC